MTNPFYERVYDYQPFTTARGETVRDEFEAVEVGFDRINTMLSDALPSLNTSIRYSANDLTTGVIAENALQRRNSFLYFDGTGQPTVQPTRELDGYNSQITRPFTAHGFTLPQHGFVPAYATLAGPRAAQADAIEHAATAFVVGVSDANTLRLAQRGFISVPAHGLSIGSVYYLGQATPGITRTQPTLGVVQPVCEVWSASDLLLLGSMPVVRT